MQEWQNQILDREGFNKNETTKNTNKMKNQRKQAEQIIANIAIGTPLFVNTSIGVRELEAYTRGEAHGERFATICKKNKLSVWIKLNNGEIIKEVYPSTFNLFLKNNIESKKVTIKEWRIITERGERYDFTNEREAIKKHKEFWAKGDKAQLMNVWK